MEVLQLGAHGEKDAKYTKVRLAKQYAQAHTAGQALLKMEADGIAVGDRPEVWRLKNCRPQRQLSQTKLIADCVSSLNAWMSHPPPNVQIHESSSCSPDHISILFQMRSAEHFLKENNHLSTFVADFTFETNHQQLVLGGIGLCGLRQRASQKPQVRMLPCFFLLSKKEDQQAQKMLFKAFATAAARNGVSLTHGFADCSCMEGIEAAISEDQTLQHVRMHRCLQHTKVNVKKESKKRSGQTGEPRLRNAEMMPVLTSFLMETAFLPCSREFGVFWSSALSRLRSSIQDADWDEAAMASYLEANILEESGNECQFTAKWRSGFGCVPNGFTTYTSNCLERSWRTIKGLLGKRTGAWPKHGGCRMLMIFMEASFC